MATSTIKANIVKSAYSKSTSGVTLATSDKNATQEIKYGTPNHGFAESNGGISVPKTGYYLISGWWTFSSLGTGANTLTCSLRKWENSANQTIEAFPMTHTGAYYSFSMNPILHRLTAGQVVFASARNNTSAVGNFEAGLTIQFVSE